LAKYALSSASNCLFLVDGVTRFELVEEINKRAEEVFAPYITHKRY
jgi:hypothetical protein